MRKHNLAFIDIEATGMDLSRHEIIEIGCVLTAPDFEVLAEFELKVKPEHLDTADKTSLKVSNYAKEQWQAALGLPEAMKIFAEKVKGAIMVGHNVAFDFAFLESAFAQTGLSNTMHYHKLDTVSIAWAKLHKEPDLEHFSLRELCRRFGIENPKAHTALSDARATLELYKKLMSL